MATITDVMTKISDVLWKWDNFLNNQLDWAGGPDKLTDPQGTGTRPLMDSAGNTFELETPAELVRLIKDGGIIYGEPTGLFNHVLSVFFAGTFSDSEELGYFLAPEAFLLPEGLTTSHFYCKLPPTGSAVISIQLNEVEIGTLTFAAASNTATAAFAADVELAAGDRLSFIAPATADSTFGDVSLTLIGLAVFGG